MISKLKEIPLLGGLLETDRESAWEATKEVAVGLIISTIPIWLGVFVMVATRIPELDLFPAIMDSTKKIIINGELYIYSSTFLAPLFWMILNKPAGADEFRNKISIMCLVFIVIILSSTLFALQRAGKDIAEDIAFIGSIGTSTISVILLYLSTIYHNTRLKTPSQLLREKQDAYLDEFIEHRLVINEEDENE